MSLDSRPSHSFHAQHSPMGAHASFTYGMFGARGGMALEKGGPANGGVHVGYEDADGHIHQFPFSHMSDDERSRYVGGEDEAAAPGGFFPEEAITREYLWATDRFEAPGVRFETVTPFFPIPEPGGAPDGDVKFACCPATFVRLSFDNTDGERPIRGFFAIRLDGNWSALDAATGGDMRGFVHRESLGFATWDEVETFSAFGLRNGLSKKTRTPHFLLGKTAGLIINVPAGESKDIVIALGYFIGAAATFNRPMTYWYTRYFANLNDVLHYALENSEDYLEEAALRDRELAMAPLNDEQKFLIAHATRSYYGSTEWLDDGGRPCWVVNEGEYLMMNTFDLTVDMLFYEMRFNPWTVRNVLDKFVAEYSYFDEVFSPDDPDTLFPGGVSFTHDMGVANHFSPRGHSSYEVSGLDRECFSHMTCEQLVNWICCAGVYYTGTLDDDFLWRNRGVLVDCLESLLNRDHPIPEKRDGIMTFESSRTWPGGEITTYDSLDHSLGQARRNLYLAVKSWAAYLALEHLFNILDMSDESRRAADSAKRCADTIANHYDEKLGFIPAVLDGENESAIIPGIEGLIFPRQMGLDEALNPDGPYGRLIKALSKHLDHILVKGVCLYDDGAWKLSSTADNSWMSKICLCMHVARTILNKEFDDELEYAFDHAHAEWEREGSKFNACSDQFQSGVAKGSLYYPRIVTNILWM
ncbi:MAG: glycoside hydrolase family 52 protein [Lentisphaeria bacterium]|nr:glycoside hydrolase family 52 protein [Lentisphaeria bacterium]